MSTRQSRIGGHGDAGPSRPSASLLVRFWLEPREAEGEAPILRGYVRNLKTGEEHFVGDFAAVEQQVLRQLALAGAASAEMRDEPTGTAAAKRARRTP